MKSLVIFFSLLVPVTVSSQWNLIYNHGDYENAIAVINKDTVVAVTMSGGRIHRSIDGGQSWTFYQTIFTQSWFNDVHFPTRLVGYTCGGSAFGTHKNVIAKTVNGGQTWDSITSNDYSGYSFTKIYFISPDTGFVSGEFDGLLKTSNGGGTFVPVSFPNGGVGNDISFQSSQTGVVSTYKYVSQGKYVYSILRTTNQGNSWAEVYTDTMSGVTGINHRLINTFQFISPSIGFATGGNGLLLKTTDGGQTWLTSTVSPGSNLTGIHFKTQSFGYLNNGGGISMTMNSGGTWIQQNLTTPTIIRQIVFANDSIGYALGDAGIYKTSQPLLPDGLNEGYEINSIQVFPNPVQTTFSINDNNHNILQATILNSLGQVVKIINRNFESINVYDLPAGVYILEIQTSMRLSKGKFIKE